MSEESTDWLPCKPNKTMETVEGNIRITDAEGHVILEFRNEDTEQRDGTLFIRRGAKYLYHSVAMEIVDKLTVRDLTPSEAPASRKDVCARFHLCIDCGAGEVVGVSDYTFTFPCKPGNC